MENLWDIQNCASNKSSSDKHTLCQRKIKHGDFCSYHISKGLYNDTNLIQLRNSLIMKTKISFTNDFNLNEIIKSFKNTYNKTMDKLDEDTEGLLGIDNSWRDIPIKNIIKIDTKYWNINVLINAFSNQLCSCDFQNPKPIYPSNPYTRKNFKPEELIQIAKHIQDNNIKIYIGLKVFLRGGLKTLKKIYIQEYGTNHETSSKITEYMKLFLRFKLINSKNSQDCYIGFWIDKKTLLSNFERMLLTYNQMPYQQIVIVRTSFFMDTEMICENYEKKILEEKLKKLNNETFNIDDEKYKEFI